MSSTEFKMYYKCLLLRLSDSTVDIFRYRVMIMLFMGTKWIEQSGYKNCRARK